MVIDEYRISNNWYVSGSNWFVILFYDSSQWGGDCGFTLILFVTSVGISVKLIQKIKICTTSTATLITIYYQVNDNLNLYTLYTLYIHSGALLQGIPTRLFQAVQVSRQLRCWWPLLALWRRRWPTLQLWNSRTLPAEMAVECETHVR